MIDGAQGAAGHQQNRKAQPLHQIQHGVLVVERHHDAAGPLDHQRCGPGQRGGMELLQLDAHPFQGRGRVGGERALQPVGLGCEVGVGQSGGPAHPRGIRALFQATLHRFPVDRAQSGGQDSADHGLADPGVGAGDKEAGGKTAFHCFSAPR